MLVNLETLKKHIGGVQTKLNFDTVLPFVKTAEREFRRQAGQELYAYLPGDTTELKELAEGCICWHAYDMALPHLKQRVGDLGMAKNAPANTIAITKWEYVDTREANMAMADLFWEFFWEELELQQPDVWKNSEAYQRYSKLFIRSASELSIYAPLVGRNRRFFAELVRFLERAEAQYISGTITPGVLADLKAKWRDGTMLTGFEVDVIEKIKFATAYLAIFEAYPYLPLTVDNEGTRQVRKKDGLREEDIADKPYRQAQRQQLFNDGQLYLAQLRSYLNENARSDRFRQYHEAYLLRPEIEPDDFTHTAHVIL